MLIIGHTILTIYRDADIISAMDYHDTNYGTIKNGVLVLSGYVARVSVENGQLQICDGLKGNTVERTFGRAHCPISRLVITQASGFISFDAVQWLHDIGAAIIYLRHDGTPVMTSVPTAPVISATLRRQQATLTMDKPLGRGIVYRLIATKTTLQIRVLEQLKCAAAANAIRERSVPMTNNALDMLTIEGSIA